MSEPEIYRALDGIQDRLVELTRAVREMKDAFEGAFIEVSEVPNDPAALNKVAKEDSTE